MDLQKDIKVSQDFSKIFCGAFASEMEIGRGKKLAENFQEEGGATVLLK